MKTTKVSCEDCDHHDCYGHFCLIDVCDAYQTPCDLPAQGRTEPVRLAIAWAKCGGKKFVPRRPWWKRLLGIW